MVLGVKENIIRARRKKGLSQAALAGKTEKLSQSQIAKIEKGNRQILASELLCIANVLDVAVDDLLTEKE
jgi:transcriptional regulator with XRE-family HTH domain